MLRKNNNRCLNRISTLTHDDGSIQRNPHLFGGEKAHERIEKRSVPAIEGKRELCVQGHDIFKHTYIY